MLCYFSLNLSLSSSPFVLTWIILDSPTFSIIICLINFELSVQKGSNVLHFLRSVDVGDRCWTVSHSEDKIYVGAQRGLFLIAGDHCKHLFQYEHFEDNLLVPTPLDCVRVFDRNVYILMNRMNKHWCFKKRNLANGDKRDITTWYHKDTDTSSNKFVIHNKTLYAASRSTNSIKCYTLAGGSAGPDIHISLSQTKTCMCVTTNGDLILCQLSPSLLVCINPMTGEQIWKRKDLPETLSIASCTSNHFLMFSAEPYSKEVSLDMRRADNGQ